MEERPLSEGAASAPPDQQKERTDTEHSPREVAPPAVYDALPQADIGRQAGGQIGDGRAAAGQNSVQAVLDRHRPRRKMGGRRPDPRDGVGAEEPGQEHGDHQEGRGDKTDHHDAETGAGGKQSGRSWVRPLIAGLAVIALIVGVLVGSNYLHYLNTHVSTDDAYLTSDVVQITPQVAGSILKLEVNDNQQVRQGQELVRLDPILYQADVAQAEADLHNAEASTGGSSINVRLTQQTTAAQVVQAQGGLALANRSIRSAQSDVSRAEAGVSLSQEQVRSALAQASGAQSQVKNVQAAYASALAARDRAVEQLNGGQAAVEAAQAAVRTAQAGLAAAAASADRADKDQVRYAVLYNEDAVSAQVLDTATATALTSRAQVESARRQVEEAQSNVRQRQSDLRSARQQVKSADAAVRQAQAQVASTQEAARAAQATAAAARETVRQSRAALQGAREAVAQQVARRTQAVGQLQQAHTGPTQVAVQRANLTSSRTRIAQARAALQTAQTNLARTRLFAPLDGRITRRLGQLGQQVAVGQQVMVLIPDNDLWVNANFKETQMKDVRVGQPCEITVDEVGGRTFRGHVDSISPATGATTALLPPDNATGNFTKVVQRVTVKILLEPDQKDLPLLRAGLSVVATIITGR